MPSTIRFFRQYLRPDPEAVVLEETAVRRGDRTLPASLFRPAGSSDPPRRLPAWIALHGLTYRGRAHPSLVSFARALAASGAAVLIPDVPEWQAFRIAPGAAADTLRAAVAALADRPDVLDRVGAIGFSFGGTQALTAATEPGLADRLTAVLSWGGYADLERTLRFGFLGDHDLDGATHHLDPDPYGRWIVTGNYLTNVPGHEDDAALADALLGLAREIGRLEILAWDAATDPIKARFREPLAPEQRATFDLVAPPADMVPSAAQREQRAELARRLARASVAAEPALDPTSALPTVPVPVFLAHGRDDRLIPWTELERLRRLLPASQIQHALVTPLFGHSFREQRFPTPRTLLEVVRFVHGVNRMVHLISPAGWLRSRPGPAP